MWWSSKQPAKEIWDDLADGPIGDIEAAHLIRDICRSASDSADRVAGQASDALAKGRKSEARKDRQAADRYQRAAKAAMGLAMKISDDLLRDAAVREIVDLCLRARDTRTAQPLFRAIQAVSIRGEVLSAHPALGSE